MNERKWVRNSLFYRGGQLVRWKRFPWYHRVFAWLLGRETGQWVKLEDRKVK